MWSARTLTAIASLLAAGMAAGAPPPEPGTPPALTAPLQSLPERKSYDALRLGPGNTFSVRKTPKDHNLVSFALSPDGRRIALGWESARVTIFDLKTREQLAQFESGVGVPLVMRFLPSDDQLAVAGPHGKLVFLAAASGSPVRKWTIPPGKYKYDLQVLLFDPKGRWLACASGDGGKVIDLGASPVVPMADLGAVDDLALAPDGSTLFTVDRKTLARYDTSTWKPTGSWPLFDVPSESVVVVRAGLAEDGRVAVAVASAKGMLLYREPEMSAGVVLDRQTWAAAYVPSRRLFLDLSKDVTFFKPDGELVCARSYGGRYDEAVSDDGQWLAFSQSERVDLWRIDDLLRDCSINPGLKRP